MCKNIKKKPDDYIASIEIQDLKKLILISNDYKKIIKKIIKIFIIGRKPMLQICIRKYF